jgi:alcohol dehydrogenase (cytochrome c)
MAWYFQASPHDTHDWDAIQTPVLFDAEFNGKPRKLLAQASRNGLFFLLDRQTGEHLVTKPFIESMNWVQSIDARGEPRRNPAKDATIDGVLVSPNSGGATNWPAPSYSPQTKLFYVSTAQNYSMFYLTDTDPHPEGYGAAEKEAGGLGNSLRALDYSTGNLVWRHDYPSGGGVSGLLSTAGKLLFAGDGSQHLIAFDPSSGKILWHTGLPANMSNGPESYVLDGKQYLLVGAGPDLYAYSLCD